MAVSIGCSRLTCFVLPLFVIGWINLGPFFNQSQVGPKPIMPYSCPFSRALGQFRDPQGLVDLNFCAYLDWPGSLLGFDLRFKSRSLLRSSAVLMVSCCRNSLLFCCSQTCLRILKGVTAWFLFCGFLMVGIRRGTKQFSVWPYWIRWSALLHSGIQLILPQLTTISFDLYYVHALWTSQLFYLWRSPHKKTKPCPHVSS